MNKQVVVDPNHTERVKAELVKAGMTSYGLLKGETRHLPEVIHPDERIGGVVYGRYEGGSGMLVATDKRVVFLDHKPFFRSTDELNYDVVSGVSVNKQGATSSVVLHTRLGDYKLRFVNVKCAAHFSRFIESRAVEIERKEQDKSPHPPKMQADSGTSELSSAAKRFLLSHDLTVLSTIDADGNVHGAAVYYTADKDNNVYVVTKQRTRKVQNLEAYHQVALTMVDENSMQTLQISGTAELEPDVEIRKKAEQKILRPRLKDGNANMPPILYIPAGDYVVICIKPLTYTFHDYKND